MGSHAPPGANLRADRARWSAGSTSTTNSANCAHLAYTATRKTGCTPRHCCELGDLFLKWALDSTSGLDSRTGPGTTKV